MLNRSLVFHLFMCGLAIACGVAFGLLPVKLSPPYYYENGIEEA